MLLPSRLVKFTRDSTELSAAGVRRAFREGRLRLRIPGSNRAVLGALDDLVFEGDEVLLDGRRLSPRTSHEHAVLNKPGAILSAPRDPRGKGDLSVWLKAMPQGIVPVGRLDRQTTGALLFTTDGDLANGILRPERHAPRSYRLSLAHPVTGDDPRLAAMRAGVDVGPYVARVASVELIDSTALGAASKNRSNSRQKTEAGEQSAELRVVLHEGRHRQIRRTCRTLGLKLIHLHRVSVGPVGVEGLAAGHWRTLTLSEVNELWRATGGHARLMREKLEALALRAQRVREQGKPDTRLDNWLERLP